MIKWKRWASVTAVVALFAYPVSWFVVQRSDAFEVATTFVREDPRVVHALGKVQQVKLPLFATYSLELSGGAEKASFELSVEGERGMAPAFVNLEKKVAWEIKDAELRSPATAVVQLLPLPSGTELYDGLYFYNFENAYLAPAGSKECWAIRGDMQSAEISSSNAEGPWGTADVTVLGVLGLPGRYGNLGACSHMLTVFQVFNVRNKRDTHPH